MEMVKIKQLKRGYGVNHPAHGYIQFRGLATKNPFTEEIKVPYQYIFLPPIDENGNTRPDIILDNGDETVELIDKYEETDI